MLFRSILGQTVQMAFEEYTKDKVVLTVDQASLILELTEAHFAEGHKVTNAQECALDTLVDLVHSKTEDDVI